MTPQKTESTSAQSNSNTFKGYFTCVYDPCAYGTRPTCANNCSECKYRGTLTVSRGDNARRTSPSP